MQNGKEACCESDVKRSKAFRCSLSSTWRQPLRLNILNLIFRIFTVKSNVKGFYFFIDIFKYGNPKFYIKLFYIRNITYINIFMNTNIII
jgi:hypothetical protein